MTNGVAFATIAGVLKKANDGAALRILTNDLRGAIARAVVYDQHLGLPLLLIDVGENLVQRGGDALALVISGNYKRIHISHQLLRSVPIVERWQVDCIRNGI